MRTFKFKAVSVAISMALALALPFGVMAADGFTSGEAFDAEWDAEPAVVEWDAVDAPVAFEDVADDFFGFVDAAAFVSDGEETPTSKPATYVPKASVRFYWKDAKYPDRTVTFDRVSVDTGEIIDDDVVYSELATIVEPVTDPTCTEPGKFKMEITIKGEATEMPNGYHVSEPFEDSSRPATGHTWEGPKIKANGEAATCESSNGATFDYYCKDCDAIFTEYAAANADKLTDAEKKMLERLENTAISVTGHDHKKETWYMLPDESTDLPKVDTLTKDKPTADSYYIVTATVCQNLRGDPKKVEFCENVVTEIKIARNTDDIKVKIVGSENIDAESFNALNLGTLPETQKTGDDDDAITVDYPLVFDPNTLDLVDCGKDGALFVKFIFEEEKTFKVDKDFWRIGHSDADAALKDLLSDLIENYNSQNKSREFPVKKHHTEVYTYELADNKLEGVVEDYVIFVDAAGNEIKTITNKEGEKNVPVQFETPLTIKSSRYCKPYDVVVKTVCTCELHKPADNKTTSTTTVTAAANPGHHLINTKTLRDIEYDYDDDSLDLYDADEDDPDEEDIHNPNYSKRYYVDLNEYDAFMADRSKYVVEVSNTATCTKEGVAVVEYICTLCGEKTGKTAEIHIDGFADPSAENSHLWKAQTPVQVDPTCTEKGSITFTDKCERCGEEQSKTLPLKKSGHKFSATPVIEWEGDKVVDPNDGALLTKTGKVSENKPVGTYTPASLKSGAHFSVYPVVKFVCEVCGKELVLPDTAYTYTITSEGAKKEGAFCQQGTIDLSAVIKITNGEYEVPAEDNNGITGKKVKAGTGEKKLATTQFMYYSSMDAYSGRTAHIAGTPVVVDSLAATETTPGYVDEVAYCTVCHAEAYRKHTVIPAIGHTHVYDHMEAKEATCDETGNVEFWFCEGCGLKWSDAEYTTQIEGDAYIIPALGHDLVKVEEVPASCKEGTIAYYHCNRCEKNFRDAAGTDELTAEDMVIPAVEGAEHTKGDAVEEVRDGKTYNVVRCTVCGDEISAVLVGPKTFKVKANKPAAAPNYMEFKLGAVEGADQYRVSYHLAGSDDPYTRVASDNRVVKVEGLVRGEVYDFTACVGEENEDGSITWGSRALNKAGEVKYVRRWHETVEQSKIAKKGDIITLEWTALEKASKYEISIAANKAMDNAVTFNAAVMNPTVVDGKVQASVDVATLQGLANAPAGSAVKFYVRIRPYTLFDGKDVAGGVSNLRAKTVKF